MNASLWLSLVGVILIPGVFGTLGLRYVIRKDRADGAEAARLEQQRQEEVTRRAVADGREPLLTEIGNLRGEIADLRVDKRDREKRIDDLLDELRGPRPRPGAPQ